MRSYSTRVRARRGSASPRAGMWLNGRKDGIDWIDVMTQGTAACFGAVSRMGVRRAPRRAGQPRGGAEEARRRGRLRRSRPPCSRASGDGTSTARRRCSAGTRPRSTSRRSSSACAARCTPHSCTGLRGVLAVPQDRRRATPRSCAGTARSATGTSLAEAHRRGVRREGRRRGRGDDRSATSSRASSTAWRSSPRPTTRMPDGAPGVGFNFVVGDTNVDHGFTHVRGRDVRRLRKRRQAAPTTR